MTLTNNSCPSCRSGDVIRLGTLPKGRAFAGRALDPPLPSNHLYRCRACLLKYRYPLLASAQYEALYNNGETEVWANHSNRNDFILIRKFVAENLRAGARILDFGCYAGDLLELLADKPYTKFGVEINTEAGQRAHAKTGATVAHSLDALPVDLRFDLIVAVDVVEHLPDPRELIERLVARLTSTGRLLITTGDAENWFWNAAGAHWWYCAIPEHIAFISEEWLRHSREGIGRSWRVEHCSRFIYQEIGPLTKVITAARALMFALLGERYMVLLGGIKRAIRRSGAPHPGGVGLLRDHLFVVLQSAGQSS